MAGQGREAEKGADRHTDGDPWTHPVHSARAGRMGPIKQDRFQHLKEVLKEAPERGGNRDRHWQSGEGTGESKDRKTEDRPKDRDTQRPETAETGMDSGTGGGPRPRGN